jgi:CubicO group peptidase (beta-lactamase class C family)
VQITALPADIAATARSELARLRVPGVAVGVIAGGTWYAAGLGVTNLHHPLEVTPDTLFQVGSTSKTFTATAVMLLSDEGRLDVEATVRTYIPDFRLRSEEDAARVTIRHLLTHYGGWMGDYFKDFGTDSNALALMVEKMADARQVTPAGFAFSYSNAAFNVLARIVEVVSGEVFESFIEERFLQPLGMDHTTYFAHDAIVHRVAAGHLDTKDGPVPSGHWRINRSIAGSSGVISSVVDQLKWAAFHMGDGTAPGGERILRAETLRAMQTPQAVAGSMCDAMGWGWMLDEVGGHRIVKHGGAINGQLSSFEFVPSLGYACTVLTNGEEGGREARDTIAAACLERFTGLRRELPEPDPSLVPSLGGYAGHYRQRLAELYVTVEDGALVVQDRQPAWRAAIEPRDVDPPPAHVKLFAPDRGVVIDGAHRGERCEFLRGDDGAVAWLRWDGRLSARVDD